MDVFGLFSVNISFSFIYEFLALSPIGMFFAIFAVLGWIPAVFGLLSKGLSYYKDYREGKYTADWQYVLLAIDIPQMNVQTPMAVEQLFSHIAGAYDKPGIRDVFYRGHKQRSFSFEIISIEGYIQFLIRTEAELRDLVEASVYAQYPQAEITEVEDYIQSAPDTFPNDTHDVWIGDIVTSEDDAFPIRSYRDFEHNISKDTVLKDPMGTFLESLTRIGQGEQMWFQILLQPIGNGWKEDAIKKVKELIGEKSSPSKGNKFFSALTDNLLTKEIGNSVNEILSQLTTGGGLGGAEESSGKDEEKNQMRYMTPGQMKTVEAIETKINKIGLKTKMRAVYLAEKQVFRPSKGVNALVGAINQFNVPTSNSLVPKVTTSQPTPVKSNQKKTSMMEEYKKRKMGDGGAKPFVLNIEELATVWHFPMSHVATPLLSKAQLKTSEPPSGLPVERLPVVAEPSAEVSQSSPGRAYVTDSGEVSYGDDDEVKFG